MLRRENRGQDAKWCPENARVRLFSQIMTPRDSGHAWAGRQTGCVIPSGTECQPFTRLLEAEGPGLPGTEGLPRMGFLVLKPTLSQANRGDCHLLGNETQKSAVNLIHY